MNKKKKKKRGCRGVGKKKKSWMEPPRGGERTRAASCSRGKWGDAAACPVHLERRCKGDGDGEGVKHARTSKRSANVTREGARWESDSALSRKALKNMHSHY